MTYEPIQCHNYDYIEIACLRKYTVTLDLLDGSQLTGQAVTTRIKDHAEFLCLKTQSDDSTEDIEVRLDTIQRLNVLGDNPEFKTVEINPKEA